MSAPRRLGGAVALWLALLSGAGAQSPSVAQVETGYLVGLVEASGCTFIRNGMAYDAVRAAAHLREKSAMVAATGAIGTTEAFIERVATRSSLTGRLYEVSCVGHERVATAGWLREALARYRASGASRASRDAP